MSLSFKYSSVPLDAKTGISFFLTNTSSPAIWSLCSCVKNTPDISLPQSPSSFNLVSIFLFDIPASTKICVFSLPIYVEFPSLPLAKLTSLKVSPQSLSYIFLQFRPVSVIFYNLVGNRLKIRFFWLF